MDWIIKLAVFLVSIVVLWKIVRLALSAPGKISEIPNKIYLLLTGFIANIADTLGLGSFAVIVAMNNRWKMIDDKQLPGTLNAQSVLPTLLQSLLFLNIVAIDLKVLVPFVLAACLGGLICGSLVARLEKQRVRQAMILGFIGIGCLIFANQMSWLPVGGDAITLPTSKILIGIPAMLLAGMLPGVGVGIYVPIQVILFFLGLSPLVAFPIMTTSGAIAQSVTAYAFVSKNEFASRESIWIGVAGFVGVLIAVPMITYVNHSTLRWLLLFIVFYNAYSTWQAYQREKLLRESREELA